jgi:hypothetical protein
MEQKELRWFVDLNLFEFSQQLFGFFSSGSHRQLDNQAE